MWTPLHQGRALRKLLAGEKGFDGWALKAGHTLALRVDVLCSTEEEVAETVTFSTEAETVATSITYQSLVQP